MSEGVGFGNYRLLRRLARGGMAEVFLARQQGVEGFERRVAIKRILPHLSDSTEFRTMFLDEARLAAQLSHPNIIHIYDFGKVDDYFYIAMEYVDGVDLGRLIKQARTSPVPFELIARTLADICAGLHYAHNISDGAGKRLNVVHRDVTPQNVLVTYDGIVKVVDFGIAKATWQASRTRPGVVKGKYAYMSPEQVEGRSLDARSDVFSAGICMYELMTGMPLFRRDNVTEAMKEIRDGKPIHPEHHRADIPPELLAILKKSLETSRDQRYATAAAMQLELERYLKSAAGMATPVLIGEFLRREAPAVSQGELLVEGADGEPVSVPKSQKPTEPPPPRMASGIAVKGGTAPISSLKQTVTPAYDTPPVGPLGNVIPSDDLTTPGKLVRSVGATPGVGFADVADDDLTRRDDRAPDGGTPSGEHATTRSAKITPPSGERPVSGERRSSDKIVALGAEQPRTSKSDQHERPGSGQHERQTGKSGQHERSGQRSGPFPGSPLGSYPQDPSEPSRPVLPSDVTAMMPNPPGVERPPTAPRGRPLLWLSLVAIGIAGGFFAVQRFAPGLYGHTQHGTPDLRRPTPTTTTDRDPIKIVTPPAPTDMLAGAATPDAATAPKMVTTALPVQTSATIAIYTRPTGAKVFIDGDVLDALTPVRMQPVTAGPHHVVIERVGCQPRELDVSLKVGEHRVLDFELPEERSLQPGTAPTPTPTPPTKKHGSSSSSSSKDPPRSAGNGFLTAKTVPWSRAYDGARLLGETPVVNVPLSEGPHTITFVNPDLPSVKKKIVVRVGEETKLNFPLQEE